jgi:hypothetical protein
MKLTKEQVEGYLNGDIANDIIIISAYAIDKTPTETDNEVIADIADYGDLIAEKLKEVEEITPTEKEAIQAALRIAQKIAEQTKTNWDDIIIGLAAKITGANKKD